MIRTIWHRAAQNQPECLFSGPSNSLFNGHAKLLDLRTLRPLDEDAILETIAKTHRAVIVDEGWKSGSISAEITARIVEAVRTVMGD